MFARLPWMMAALLLIFGCGFLLGLRHSDARHSQAAAAARQAWQQQQQTAAARLAALQSQLQQQQQQHAVQRQVMEQQLEQYRLRHRQRVALPADWRLQHDRAALPAPAQPAANTADTARATDDLAALDTVSRNYALCQQWRTALSGWQAWYAQVSGVAASPD